jgi:hypothetical protein
MGTAAIPRPRDIIDGALSARIRVAKITVEFRYRLFERYSHRLFFPGQQRVFITFLRPKIKNIAMSVESCSQKSRRASFANKADF